eukprot:CAMPEP_0184485478 /NCGR_PEP_ID=MMETSP0113_2-20130426/7081_1 /TAXON_ID=91329 /ORGANISM="Norrisiella sphaerica, Strain BC52" /LENGTH=189 /DNA_ID=CAMNT_0026866937 /DNA_START=129 /DNA_END=698 /DNA_ORIENTATION=+
MAISNPDVTTLLMQIGFYVIFAVIAYFAEAGQNFELHSVKELRWVLLDTIILLIIYGFYRFREGMTKEAYDIESKKESAEEPLLPPQNAQYLIQNASRTAGNLSEQLPNFVLCTWLYSCVRPFTAGVIGAIELVLIVIYPFVYGTGPKPTKLLSISTIPRYILNEYMVVAALLTLFGLTRSVSTAVPGK